MKKLLLKLTLVVTLLAMFVPAGLASAKTVDEIKESGQLVVGTSADYPPFEWVVLESNGDSKIVGIDVDLAQLIADELGVELVMEDMPFDSLIPSVISGRIDMTIAGMTYTEERAEQVDFSEQYHQSVSNFVVLAGEEGKYETVEDFDGLKIGVQKGTVQEQMVTENLANAEIVSMQKTGLLIEALKTKKVDAIFIDDIVTIEFVAVNEGQIAVVSDVVFENPEQGKAVALAKGNEELLELINKVVLEAVESGKITEFIEANVTLQAESADEEVAEEDSQEDAAEESEEDSE
ncbi:transporter substrate-binding domain-containing protein [Fundicoccus sp. Sow4_F4]|uniref:transporter substrate-binding domain-containing protein n=1 Tax=Fundicoccus sp. Sow4_F4 TaxID=3438783 RepID=UPI003F8E4EA6